MKARNISVSVVENGDGTVKVWSATLTVPGTIRKDGKVDEVLRRKLEKQIAAVLATVEF